MSWSLPRRIEISGDRFRLEFPWRMGGPHYVGQLVWPYFQVRIERLGARGWETAFTETVRSGCKGAIAATLIQTAREATYRVSARARYFGTSYPYTGTHWTSRPITVTRTDVEPPAA